MNLERKQSATIALGKLFSLIPGRRPLLETTSQVPIDYGCQSTSVKARHCPNTSVKPVCCLNHMNAMDLTWDDDVGTYSWEAA